MSATQAPRTRRYDEQRWLLDIAIATVGVEWDQPRLAYTQAPCGAEAGPDFRAVAAQVKRAADIGPAFEAAAALREAKARQAEADGHRETARALLRRRAALGQRPVAPSREQRAKPALQRA